MGIKRAANGYTKRANSVNLLYNSLLDINQKINYCKEFYENLGLPVIYKIISHSNSLNVDHKLKNLGYIKIDETSVRLLDLSSFSSNCTSTSQVLFQPTQDWLEGYIASCRTHNDRTKDTKKIMLKNIIGKTVFVIHKVENRPVGFGYGVIENEYVGIFDILVDETFRGRGYGKLIMNKILNESKQLGAKNAYLQVVLGNTAAEKLYRNLGFKEIYRYWYRKLLN